MLGTEQLMAIIIAGLPLVALYWFIAGIAIVKGLEDQPNEHDYY